MAESKDYMLGVLSLPLLHPTCSDAEEGGINGNMSKDYLDHVPSQPFRERTTSELSKALSPVVLSLPLLHLTRSDAEEGGAKPSLSKDCEEDVPS